MAPVSGLVLIKTPIGVSLRYEITHIVGSNHTGSIDRNGRRQTLNAVRIKNITPRMFRSRVWNEYRAIDLQRSQLLCDRDVRIM